MHKDVPGDGIFPETTVQTLGGERAYTSPQTSVTPYLPCHEQRTANTEQYVAVNEGIRILPSLHFVFYW